MQGRFARLGQRIAALLVCALAISAAAESQAALAAGAPQLGKTAEAVPIRGRVFLTPFSGHRVRLASARLIPMGSILYARHGSVRITSATNNSGATDSAVFQGGPFRILQPAGEHGTLEVHLVDGNMRCNSQAFAARAGPGGGPSTWVNARGGHHVKVFGRNGSGRGGRGRRGRRRGGRRYATIASAVAANWTTVDNCRGTTIVDHFGEVATTGRNTVVQSIPISFTLTNPTERIAYTCGGGLVPYCAVVRSSDPTTVFHGAREQMPKYQLTFVTRDTSATEYDLEISPPNSTPTVVAYPLPARPGPGGYRRSDVTCVPNQGKGQYGIVWRISGVILADMIYQAPAPSPTGTSCTSVPFGVGAPADLTQQVSVREDFVVHYTTDTANNANAVPNTHAAMTVGNTAERALTYYEKVLGMPGWKPPITGPIHIYIESSTLPFDVNDQTLVEPTLPDQVALPARGQPTRAYITLFPRSYNNPYDVAFAVFWALRVEGIGRIGMERAALPYSTGVWAANSFVNSLGGSASQYTVDFPPNLSQPLDCDLTCADNPPVDKWRFFQYLAEQYGPTVVAKILEIDAADARQNPGAYMDAALQAALPQGVSLASALAGYAVEDLTNGWTVPWIGATGLSVGNSSSAVMTLHPGQSFSSQVFSVGDLAVEYPKVVIPPNRPCTSETLTLNAVVPPGGLVPDASVQVRNKYSTVAPNLMPGTTTQSVAVPLSSCIWTIVRLPLVNGTTGSAPLTFSVSGSLSIP